MLETSSLALDRPLIQIRERTFPDLLDLALVVARNEPKSIALASLAGVFPFVAFNTWLMANLEPPFVVYLILLLLEAPWATLPLTVVLGGLMFGERRRARDVVRTMGRCLPALVAYQLLARAAMIGFFLAYPLIPTRLAFLNEVILLEQSRFKSVVKRCTTLCGTRGGDFFAHWIAQIFLGFLFVVCFHSGTGAALSALTTNQLTWDTPASSDLLDWRMQAATWMAICFFAIARFLQYIDQRIRLEGWEVKIRLQAVGNALEEDQRS